jgi:hypothetical protein
MTGARNHRVLPVGSALIRPARVDANVRDNAQSTSPARVPKRAEISAVQAYDAGVRRKGIETVAEKEIDDPGTGVVMAARQKSAALPAMATAQFAQACNEPAPQKPRAGELMPRLRAAPRNPRW